MIRLSRYLRGYRPAIVLALLFVFLQSLSTLYLPRLMSDIVNTGILQGKMNYILEVGAVMLLVAIGGAVCSIFGSFLASRVSAGFGLILRREVFEHVEHFTLNEFDKLGTASLITRTTNDVTQVQMLVNMMLRMMVMAPMMAIGGIIMAVLTDARLSLIIVIILPLMFITLYTVLRRGMALFRAMQKKIDTLNRVLRENLIGVRVVRAFNRIQHEHRRFDTANRDLTDTAIRAQQIMALLMPIMMLIVNAATLAIVWFGSVRINNGTMQIGNLMAFLQYVMQILFAVMMVSMMFFMIPRASASAARISEVLDTEPEIVDPPDPLTGPTPSAPSETVADGATHTASGEIAFQDVTFSYPGAEKPALSHITFTARPGETTAIIGGTGSGKSTLINLIPRFYDVDEGHVLVDGLDIREMRQADLRSKLGLVPEKAMLFSGTIADNIAYGVRQDTSDDSTTGAPDAANGGSMTDGAPRGVSTEEIRRAAQIAQAEEFIEHLEHGYESWITQGGTNLSGGQKQRLSIARALCRRPQIYLFDDSFSALDFKTDAKLRWALREEVKGATVLIVAQRVSTVMSADQIVVLDEGQVAGIGTHQSLLETCKVYQEIVESQLGEGASA